MNLWELPKWKSDLGYLNFSEVVVNDDTGNVNDINIML